MRGKFPNLVKENVPQVQEAHRVPIKISTKALTPRHIMSKMAKFKDKEKIFKSARERQSYLQGSSDKAVG